MSYFAEKKISSRLDVQFKPHQGGEDITVQFRQFYWEVLRCV